MVPYQHGPVQPYDNKQSSYHGQAPPQHVMHYQQQQQQPSQPMVVHEGEKKNKFGRIGEQVSVQKGYVGRKLMSSWDMPRSTEQGSDSARPSPPTWSTRVGHVANQ